MNEAANPDIARRPPLWRRPEILISAFFLVYVVCGLAAQVISDTDPSEEGSAIEAFTSGLLWILAAFGLLSITQNTARQGRFWFWVAFTASVGALAVDEIIGVHERTEPNLNDDWLKIVLWIVTAFVLYTITRFEDVPITSIIAFVAGYAVQATYLFVELGDGEYFDLPISIESLKTAEEVFELLFLALYALGLWLLVPHREARRARR